MSEKSKTDHLEKLLMFAPPKELRRSVQKTLFAYQLEQDEQNMDVEFKKVVEDLYFLIDFLDKIEDL